MTALIMAALRSWIGFPAWIVVAAVLIGVVKDLLLFRAVRNVLASDVSTGIEQMKGSKGVVSESLDPDGYVKVRGELWRARTSTNEQTIAVGSRVVVRDLDGMTLVVSKDNP